jgi:hypothetical protein
MAQSECMICIEKLFNNIDHPDVVQLHCQHMFHRGCLNNWKSVKAECPICKRSIGEGNAVLVAHQNNASHIERAAVPEKLATYLRSKAAESDAMNDFVELTSASSIIQKYKLTKAELEHIWRDAHKKNGGRKTRRRSTRRRRTVKNRSK